MVEYHTSPVIYTCTERSMNKASSHTETNTYSGMLDTNSMFTRLIAWKDLIASTGRVHSKINKDRVYYSPNPIHRPPTFLEKMFHFSWHNQDFNHDIMVPRKCIMSVIKYGILRLTLLTYDNKFQTWLKFVIISWQQFLEINIGTSLRNITVLLCLNLSFLQNLQNMIIFQWSGSWYTCISDLGYDYIMIHFRIQNLANKQTNYST